MLGNRPAQETELVGPICARFGLSVETARLLISEGRKVGFVVDCGSLPLSVRCFVEEFPTPSTSMERNSSRGKALCLLPKGFKVVGLVEGSVYLGEVVYDDNWKRSYKFHLVEGPEIVKSSMPCSNPTSAFKEIEAVIKVQTNKKRQRKPDARSNGKLYMAVMYSATQRLLREKFKDCASKVPEDVRPIFVEWLENRSSNKAFAAGSHDATVVPMPHSSATKSSIPLPRHSSAPVLPLFRSVHSTQNGLRSGEVDPSGSPTSDFHLSFEDAQIDSFFSEKAYMDSNPSAIPIMAARKRSSGSIDEYGALLSYTATSNPADSLASRKRSSGSIDEHSPMLLTRKRASGSIDEESALFKELEPAQPNHHQHLPGMTAPMVADAGDLFADCFRLSGEDLANPSALSSHGENDRSSYSTSSLSSLTAQQSFDGQISAKDSFYNHSVSSPSGSMSASELYNALREPQRSGLSASSIRAALATLLQVPLDSVSLKHVEDVTRLASGEQNGRNGKGISLDSFITALESKETELREQFKKLDVNGEGLVTLEALGRMNPSDMEDLQERMDSLTFSATGSPRTAAPQGVDRKLNFDQFKNVMLPLPLSGSIRTVVDLVRASLSESVDLDLFSF